jgi:transposase, IS30 family
MRCYSHLSDDEREQVVQAKALGHSIGAIAQAIGRSKSTISRKLCRNRLPSGRYSPLHAAGAYRAGGVKRSSLTDLRCRPARGRVDPRANCRLAEGRKRTWSAGRGLRDDLRLHLPGSPTGRAVMALSHAPAQTPPPAPVETFANRVSIHERPKKIDARTEGGHWEGVTSSFVSAHGRCSFSMSANRA